MCLCDLYDVPVAQLEPALIATWRTVHPLSLIAAASPSLSPEREVAVVGGLDTESAA